MLSLLTLRIVCEAFIQNTKCQKQGPQCLQGLSPPKRLRPLRRCLNSSSWARKLFRSLLLRSYVAVPRVAKLGLHWRWEWASWTVCVRGEQLHPPKITTTLLRELPLGSQGTRKSRLIKNSPSKIMPLHSWHISSWPSEALVSHGVHCCLGCQSWYKRVERSCW